MCPAVHDWECLNCKAEMREQLAKPTECGCGKPDWQWHVRYWNKDQNPLCGARDFKTSNDLVDDRGFRRRFRATEDPTVMAELGLGEDKGISTFNIDQKMEYVERMMKDGDTPKLRRQVLDQRIENLKASGQDAPQSWGE